MIQLIATRPGATLVAVVLTLGLAFPPTDARAQTTTGVYYDYAQVSVGGVSQFVLVPRETASFRMDGPLQVTLPQAFRVLRENKRATYGNASLTLSDDDLAAGRVVVHIDPEQRQWFQIVAAETVYTFTALGIREVSFPGVAEHAWTRTDVPFGAFVLHVPMWRALPPARMASAIILLPDGTRLDADTFYSRWESGDRELQAAVLNYITDGGPIAQRGVLAVLADLGLSGAESAVLDLLESPDAATRLLAVEYLAASGSATGMERLASMLESDPDAEVRSAAAAALGSSGEAHFQFFELSHALENASGAAVAPAVTALSETGDLRAVDALIPYVNNPDAAVVEAAIVGLASMGAEDRLVGVLDDPAAGPEAKLRIASVLAEGDDGPNRVRGLEYLVASQEGTAAVNALYRLRSSSAEEAALAAMERQLSHNDDQLRIEAARILAQLGSPTSLEAIGSASRSETEPAVRDALGEAAVALMLEQPRETIAEHAEGGDLFLKRTAFRVLGERAQRGQADQGTRRLLTEGLQDAEPTIRGAAVLGLASFADVDTFEAISPLANDPDPAVRRDVARALSGFSIDEGRTILHQLLEDADPHVVAAALDAIGERAATDFLPEVLALTQNYAGVVRAAAATAASKLSTEEVEQTVIDALMGAANDREPEVRAAAAGALARFDNELAILGISPLTQDRELDVRLAAIGALGVSGIRSAMGVLTSLLHDPDPRIRLAALAALGELGLPAAVADIRSAMATESDAAVQEAGRLAIQRLESE